MVIFSYIRFWFIRQLSSADGCLFYIGKLESMDGGNVFKNIRKFRIIFKSSSNHLL